MQAPLNNLFYSFAGTLPVVICKQLREKCMRSASDAGFMHRDSNVNRGQLRLGDSASGYELIDGGSTWCGRKSYPRIIKSYELEWIIDPRL